MPILIFLLFLFSCSSSPTLRTTDADTATEPAPTTSKDHESLSQQAKIFDRFITGQLNVQEVTALKESCKPEPNDNRFCLTVMNAELFEQRFKTKDKKNGIRPTSTAVPPRVVRKRVVNWLDLRFAPTPQVLRGLSAARPSDFQQVRRLAYHEKRCPNNAATAVAALLEDRLPDDARPDEIAQLYEKGGSCLAKNVVDQETILTRAGLFYFFEKQYKKAKHVLRKATDVEGAFVGRPLYWLYRSELELGEKDEAAETFEKLKSTYPFAFHTLVALTANNKDPGEILTARLETKSAKRSDHVPIANLLIEQVEILRQFGYEKSASKVLDWAVVESQEAEPEVKLYLAELKHEEGDNVSKITILSDILYKNPALISKQTMELYFPKVFFPVFEKRTTGIDPYLLLAIARQESAFNPKAISSANAQGLLQINPHTSLEINKGKKKDLMDPDTNVETASRLLQELFKKLNGQMHLVLAAYNAGANKLSSWLIRYPTTEPILLIDLIPYRETRDYVASVIRNYYWYRRIHLKDSDGPPKKLFDTGLYQSR